MDLELQKKALAVCGQVFETTAAQAVDCDFTLPDYCPDISRVIKCWIEPRLLSRQTLAERVNLEGCAAVKFIYCDEEALIRTYETEVPFNKNIETGDAGEGVQLMAKTKLAVDFVNCKALCSQGGGAVVHQHRR